MSRFTAKIFEISCLMLVCGIRLDSQIFRYSKYMAKEKGCQPQNHDGI